MFFLSHDTALKYWRSYRVSADAKRFSVSKRNPPTSPQAISDPIKDLLVLEESDSPLPLDVLVGSDWARTISPMINNHIDSHAFPHGSFVKIKQGLYVSSPELCFLQMANQLELIQLIKLGFELCGSYRLDDAIFETVAKCEIISCDMRRGFRPEIPLTTVRRLSAYISKMKGARGIKKASRAMRFLVGGSASPAETTLTMMLSLPYMLGGFKLPTPSLNVRIDISRVARKTTAREFYVCDLFWPNKKVAVEYDSDAFHAKSEQISQDATRRNALFFSGITVITVTRRQLKSSIEMRRVAHLLSRLLAKRLLYRDPEFTEKHMMLRKSLLKDWHFAQGSSQPLSTEAQDQPVHEHHRPAT